jgi:hypothetical protein
MSGAGVAVPLTTPALSAIPSVPAVGLRPALNEVERSPADARDEKLKHVIALLDGMEERGAAARLIDAVRMR